MLHNNITDDDLFSVPELDETPTDMEDFHNE